MESGGGGCMQCRGGGGGGQEERRPVGGVDLAEPIPAGPIFRAAAELATNPAARSVRLVIIYPG